MSKNQEAMMKKLFENLSNKVSAVHPSPEESSSLDHTNNVIRGLLQRIQNKIHSDRAWLFLFHNGGKSLSGLSFQKMSCINEVVAKGIAPCTSTAKDLYRANYVGISDALKSEGCYSIDSLSEIEETDPYIYYFFKDRHAHSVYLVSLEDADGYIIGFVGVEYCSHNSEIDKDSIIKTIKEFSLRISTMVDMNKTNIKDNIKESTKEHKKQ